MQSENAAADVFLPRLISWNLTYRCNLRCAHCYLDAAADRDAAELSTDAAKGVIDQIADVSSPILVLSGGEPLLRSDLLEIAVYGRSRGLRMALGTNGTLVDDAAARDLRRAGIEKAAISLDASGPGMHDRFRGVPGAWARAVEGILACRENGIGVQLHTTVTPENCYELETIIGLGEDLGIRDFQIFFLVPTGRGSGLKDIAPQMYESLIRRILQKIASSDLSIRPTCAPQFMRIASQMGIRTDGWKKGCIAGQSYCRITPTGEVTPCPYLPLGLGNILDVPFRAIWFRSRVLQEMRDPDALQGRCGRCEYRSVCGGCRARAYGLTGGASHACGGTLPSGDGSYLAEDPWCPYEPDAGRGSS